MAEQFGSSTSNSLLIVIPERGEKDWDQDIKNLCFIPIHEHDHTGSGRGAQIGTDALELEAVTAEKIANGTITGAKISSSASDDSLRAIESNHIKDDAIVLRHLSDNVIANSSLFDNAVLGSGLGKSGSAIKVNVDGQSLSIQNDILKVNVDGSTIVIDPVALHITIPDGAITLAKLDSYLTTQIEGIQSTLYPAITAAQQDIFNLDTRLTTAESNISSNDTDIVSLNNRLTTVENDKITATEAQTLIDASSVDTQAVNQLIDAALVNYSNGDLIQELVSNSSLILDSGTLDYIGNVDSFGANDGDVLTFNSTSNNWESAAPSVVGSGNIEMLVADAGSISISTSGEYQVFSSSAIYNPDSLINTSNRFVVPSAGVYIINIFVDYGGSASSKTLFLMDNQTNDIRYMTENAAGYFSTGDIVASFTSGQSFELKIQSSIGVTADFSYTIKKIS